MFRRLPHALQQHLTRRRRARMRACCMTSANTAMCFSGGFAALPCGQTMPRQVRRSRMMHALLPRRSPLQGITAGFPTSARAMIRIPRCSAGCRRPIVQRWLTFRHIGRKRSFPHRRHRRRSALRRRPCTLIRRCCSPAWSMRTGAIRAAKPRRHVHFCPTLPRGWIPISAGFLCGESWMCCAMRCVLP